MTALRTKHARSLVAAALAVLVAAPACGLGNKQAQADLISRSRKLAVSTGAAKGTLRVEMIPVERPLGVQIPEPAEGADPIALWLDVEVAFDFDGGRVQSVIPASEGELSHPELRRLFEFESEGLAGGAAAQAGQGGQGGQAEGEAGTDTQAVQDAAAAAAAAEEQAAGQAAPEVAGTPGTAVFRGTVSFLKRTTMRKGERRSWAKLDYRRLDEDEAGVDLELSPVEVLQVAAATMNPQFVLDMVLGVLPGSVEIAGPAALGDISVTKYKANISRDKVMTELDLDDDVMESRLMAFRLLGIGDGADVVPAEFWVDADKRVRRVRIELPQTLRRDIRNTLALTLELPEYGASGVEIPSPGREETIEVDRFGRVIRAGLPVLPDRG